MNFCGIPVVISADLGLIVRTKRWKRRGIGRLPKVRTRMVRRDPVMYWVHRPDGASSIVANNEGWIRLQETEPDVRRQLQNQDKYSREILPGIHWDPAQRGELYV